jgi:N-acetylneuraminate synthase
MEHFMNWQNWYDKAHSNSPEIAMIAEIGINHNGDLNLAKELMLLAKSTGCDAVKFQKRNINKVYTPDFLDSPRESAWGTTQRDQKLGLEFSNSDYEEINKFAEQIGISWTASAWDLDSLVFVERFNPPFHKIASAFITNLEFLSAVAALGRLTLLSTGMSTIADIDKAVEIFKQHNCPIVLLHCVATYPAKKEILNLRTITTLKQRFPEIPIGYSGHESNVSPTIVAVALGAVVVERHITLDRAMPGSDQAASLEPAGLRNLVGAIKQVPAELGTGEKKYMPGELETAQKLRYWEQ